MFDDDDDYVDVGRLVGGLVWLLVVVEIGRMPLIKSSGKCVLVVVFPPLKGCVTYQP